MAAKIDSASWTGDTSYRESEFTPATKARIGKWLAWIGACTVAGLLVAAIVKGVM